MLPQSDTPTPLPIVQRLSRWTLCVVVVLSLAACSILQALYEQAPRYVQWRTNVAHRFSSEQYDAAKLGIRQWFAWHRRVQMPQVATMLRQAATDVRGPITPALACERRDSYVAMAKQAIASAAPLAAAVLVQLGPHQPERVQSFFDDINEDFRDDFFSDDPREQARMAVAFIEKWGALVYGSFDAEQRIHMEREVIELPFNARTILGEMQRFQARYVQLLKDAQAQRMSADQVAANLQAILVDGLDPQEPKRKAQMRTWVQAGCAFAAELHGQTSAAQRAHAVRSLEGWRADVDAIVASP